MLRLRMLPVMSAALLVTSGCALLPKERILVSDYCSLHVVEYWTQEAKDWLLDNDPEFYDTVVANNKKHKEICGL